MAEPLSDIGASIAAKAAARVKAKMGGQPAPAPKSVQAAPTPVEAAGPEEAPDDAPEGDEPATGQPEAEKPKLSQDDLQKLVDEGHEDQVMAILGIKVGAARARRAKRKEAEAASKLADAESKMTRVQQQSANIRRQYTPYAMMHAAIAEERWADVVGSMSSLLPKGMSWSQFVATVGEQGSATGGEAALQRRVAQLEQALRKAETPPPAAATPAPKPKIVLTEALKGHAVTKLADWKPLVSAELRRHKKPEGGFSISPAKAAANVLARHGAKPEPPSKPRVRDQAGKYSAPVQQKADESASINTIFEKAKMRALRSKVAGRR